MYYYLKDFFTEWDYESETTLKLFRNLTDESLQKQVHPNVRTLGFLSWHIIHTMQEMLAKTGLSVDIKEQQNYNGESVKELCDTYEKGSKSLVNELKKKWTDAELEKKDEMYGEFWKRGTTLNVLIKHQAHHRAEMIVLMRILGLKVIGPYGPVKEDWAQWGMESMK